MHQSLLNLSKIKLKKSFQLKVYFLFHLIYDSQYIFLNHDSQYKETKLS